MTNNGKAIVVVNTPPPNAPRRGEPGSYARVRLKGYKLSRHEIVDTWLEPTWVRWGLSWVQRRGTWTGSTTTPNQARCSIEWCIP